MEERHMVRPVTQAEQNIACDCNNGRTSALWPFHGKQLPIRVSYVCSCSKQACESCMKSHIFILHFEIPAGG